ncbi:MAG TPA: hypothetical protein VFE65_00590 [Pseudonocardia sp.]|jgi:hypothetical protein|nr:hypothetical protein [Pseudonocardia sp.]
MNVSGEQTTGAAEMDGPLLPLQLSPSVHGRLAGWCRETARVLQTSGVARGDVLEALIDQLLNNPDTSMAVRRRLAALAYPQP